MFGYLLGIFTVNQNLDTNTRPFFNGGRVKDSFNKVIDENNILDLFKANILG